MRRLLNHRLNFFSRCEAISGSGRDPPTACPHSEGTTQISCLSLLSPPQPTQGMQRSIWCSERVSLCLCHRAGRRLPGLCVHVSMRVCTCASENICIPQGSLTGWPLDPGSPWLPGSPVPPAVPRLPGAPSCPGNPLSPLKKKQTPK